MSAINREVRFGGIMESKHMNLVQNSMANPNILVVISKNVVKMLKIGAKVVKKIAQISLEVLE